jgi:hypothetical protein
LLSYIIYIDEVALSNIKFNTTSQRSSNKKKAYPTKEDDPQISSKIRR